MVLQSYVIGEAGPRLGLCLLSSNKGAVTQEYSHAMESIPEELSLL